MGAIERIITIKNEYVSVSKCADDFILYRVSICICIYGKPSDPRIPSIIAN